MELLLASSRVPTRVSVILVVLRVLQDLDPGHGAVSDPVDEKILNVQQLTLRIAWQLR